MMTGQYYAAQCVLTVTYNRRPQYKRYIFQIHHECAFQLNHGLTIPNDSPDETHV